jgi:hypothetical protein
MSELAIYEPTALPALPARVGIPGTQDFDSWVAVASDVVKLANVICDTPFVPDGLRGSGPATAAAILAGREMGLGPMTSLANLDVIKGKPSQKAVLMRAMILSRGHKWVDVDVSDVRVVIKGCRKGETDWTEVTFTQANAKTAGIDLGKYPADKLYARATSRLARRKFADVIMGMPYSDDELEDGVADAGELAEPQPAAIEAAKPAGPRTAQRRQRTEVKAAEQPSPAETASSAVTKQETPAEGLPPLPGEDQPDEHAEPDVDPAAPGSITAAQITALWTIFSRQLGFTSQEKADARAACEKITGRKLTGGTTGNLSQDEFRAVADTLSRCRTRDRLLLLMNDGVLPDEDGDDANPAEGEVAGE